MNNFNWIIVQSRDRGTEFGVGTFIKNLCEGLKSYNNINVVLLEINVSNITEFEKEISEGVTYLRFPETGMNRKVDTRKKQVQIAKNICRIAIQHFPTNENTIIHLNFLFQFFIGYEFVRDSNCKLIFTQHILPTGKTKIDNYFDFEKFLFEHTDKIISVTNNGKNYLLNRSAPPEKITCINNGINHQFFERIHNHKQIRKKYGINFNDKIILYSGRLEEGKGLKYLLNAFQTISSIVTDCRLVIAGNGNFEKIIEQARPFSSKISYLGFVPFNDLISLYHESSIGVIPSLKEECSFVALEMLHSGLPVVASNIGGLSEIFDHGKDAFLVETIANKNNPYGRTPSIRQLSEYILKLLKDKNLRKQFSPKAIEKAKTKYSQEIMVNKYIELIDNLY